MEAGYIRPMKESSVIAYDELVSMVVFNKLYRSTMPNDRQQDRARSSFGVDAVMAQGD